MFGKIKKVDLIIAALFLLAVISYFAFPTEVFRLFLLAFGATLFIRLLIIFKRKILWKTRNRLIFSSLFFVVTPIILISVFFFFIIYILIAQYGIIIVDNYVKRQLSGTESVVDRYIALKDQTRMLEQTKVWIRYKPKNLAMIFFEKQGSEYREFFKYPAALDFKKFRMIQFSGYFKLNNQFYLGTLKEEDNFAVLFATHLNDDFLDQVATISDFKIKLADLNTLSEQDMKVEEISSLASSSLDIGLFPWPYKFKFIDFDAMESARVVEREHLYWVLVDYDKLFQKIRALGFGSVQMNIQKFIYFLIGLFATFIVISIFIGLKIISVITRSINQITKGTQRIRKGDFSVRIKIKSGDQLQYLGESFNEMASGIGRLLMEEKKKQRLEEELRIARSIQLKLLPHDDYDTEEFEIAAVNIPADEIAGDYFDYFYKKGEYMYILVADVSGKGTSAAFYMAELKGVVNYLQKLGISPAPLIGECHAGLNRSFDKMTFITMNIAQFKIPEKKFIFSRAGHTQALLYRAGEDSCVELHPEGMAIGLINFSGDRIEELEIPYEKDDVLFLFSDGLSEIMNEAEEMLGVENLKRLILENHDGTAGEIKQKILDFSIKFSGLKVNRDDLTFIVLKVK
jgi:serine phosphatase RsbU (regulator of sigma subunit)